MSLPSFTDISAIADTVINTLSRNKEIITGVVTGASETTRLVITATNNEQWGPTGPQMRQISELTFNNVDCHEILEAIWERLSGEINGSNWRNIYKSLLLLDYIIRNGSERVVNEARQNIYQLKSLTTVIHFIDSEGVDRGVSIRERSKIIVDLLGDTVRLREERKKCKQTSEKYKIAFQGNDQNPYMNQFDEEENTFPTRFDKNQFSITAQYFQEIEKPPAGSIKTKKTLPDPEEKEEFEPFSEPTSFPSTPAGFPLKSQEWDPFPSLSPPASSNLDNFNPRPVPNNTNTSSTVWPSQASNLISPPINSTPIISYSDPIISPIISNPISPTIPTTQSPVSKTIPPNLFKTSVESNTGTFTNTSSPIISTAPQESSKNNQVSPIKSSDTWAAHSHLFSNLSIGTTTSPNKTTNSSNNTINTGGGKPLGATVGTGWPQTTTPPLTYTYSVPVTTFPLGYSTYPPSIPSNMVSNQNYSNTSTWGI